MGRLNALCTRRMRGVCRCPKGIVWMEHYLYKWRAGWRVFQDARRHVAAVRKAR